MAPTTHSGPLTGVRILAIEQMQALPFATQLLSHLGAEVVKIEHPVTGDSARGSLPAVDDIDGQKVGATYLRNGLNKRSICIDLKQPEGVELVKRLAGNYDVLGENFKPGTMQRLGLGYDALAELHPSLIYVSVSGFGNLRESPYANWPAYACVAEAMAGFNEEARYEGEAPRIGTAGALGDIGSSLFGAIGMLAALHERQRTGLGQHVDVAMYDAMVAMADLIPFFWSMGIREGDVRTPGVLTAFKAKDGYFVVQAVREHHLEAFANAVGQPNWIGDDRLKTRHDWHARMDDIVRPAVEAWAASRSKLEVCNELCSKGIAAGPCNKPTDLIADPHIRDHDMLLEIDRPDSEDPLLVVGNPIKLSKSGERPPKRWPALGEHTDEILREDLGLSDAEIAGLRDSGIAGHRSA